MPNLKDLKNRISGVKSTQKITKAMRMVAASKLIRARRLIENSKSYITKMKQIVSDISISEQQLFKASPIMSGSGKSDSYLFVVITSDKGLCGSLNANLIKQVLSSLIATKNIGKKFKIYCIGKKGNDLLSAKFEEHIILSELLPATKSISHSAADKYTKNILELFEKGEFDIAYIFYNNFKSVISHIPTKLQIIPFDGNNQFENGTTKTYLLEPNANQILTELLAKNLSVQLYEALLNSIASEFSARMNARENATNNSNDIIKKLTLKYNKTRQASITNELIEIISGAEALK